MDISRREAILLKTVRSDEDIGVLNGQSTAVAFKNRECKDEGDIKF